MLWTVLALTGRPASIYAGRAVVRAGSTVVHKPAQARPRPLVPERAPHWRGARMPGVSVPCRFTGGTAQAWTGPGRED